ncbi:MAG: dihydrofolate reductase [Gammaproteobacteria bacterium]|nr:dihydrofolate reductase [Gammaproteobacteria bacterium]
MSSNGVIGRGNIMPWKLHADMQNFRRVTMGKPVVMGRKTFQSLKKPLPGRLNIVLSRDRSLRVDGVRTTDSASEALEIASAQCEIDGQDELFVIGGAEIYALTLPLADRFYLTEIHAQIDGDTWFPAFDRSAWTEVTRVDVPASDKDSHAVSLLLLTRSA